MTYEFIKYEASDGIGRVTLNRPEKLNALSPQLQAELIECLTDADEDPDIRVITLRGAGRAFVLDMILRRLKQMKIGKLLKRDEVISGQICKGYKKPPG